MSFLKSGRTTRPAAALSIIAVAVYHASAAEMTKIQPAQCSVPVFGEVRNAIAATAEPAANVPSTAVTPPFPSSSAPSVPENVIAARAMNQNPSA
jgi:hypothetical protein